MFSCTTFSHGITWYLLSVCIQLKGNKLVSSNVCIFLFGNVMSIYKDFPMKGLPHSEQSIQRAGQES